MLNNKLYFELPSYSRLNVIGQYQLNIVNTDHSDIHIETIFEDDCIDTIELVNTSTQSYVLLDIYRANADFSLRVYDDFGNSDTIVLNTGDNDYMFNVYVDSQYTIGSEKTVLTIGYDVIGMPASSMEIIYDKQHKVEDGEDFTPLYYPTSMGAETYPEFDYQYDVTKPFSVKPKYSQETKSYATMPYSLFYKALQVDFGNAEIAVTFGGGQTDTYIGYSEIEGAFIYDVVNDPINKVLKVYFAPNSSNRERTTTLSLKIGDITRKVEFTQQANPDAYSFNYGERYIGNIGYYLGDYGVYAPAIFTSPEVRANPVKLNMPNGYKFEIDAFSVNATGISNPLTADVGVVDDDEVSVVYETNDSTTNYLNRRDDQVVNIALDVYIEGFKRYFRTEYINIVIQAPAKTYVNQVDMTEQDPSMDFFAVPIEIDNLGNINGRIEIDETDAYSLRFYNLPNWIKNSYFNVKLGGIPSGTGTIELINVEPNDSGQERTAMFSIELIRRFDLQKMKNYITVYVTQQPNQVFDKSRYHKSFEDVYIDSHYGKLTEIFQEDIEGSPISLYYGRVVDKINLSEFAKDLFDVKKDVVASSYVDMEMLRRIYYNFPQYGSTQYPEYFIYDYSGDTTDHFDITDIYQPLDYYDYRQLVFESVFTHPTAPKDIEVGGKKFLSTEIYHKYNMTLQALNLDEMKLQYKVNGETKYGRTYKGKCTKAKYAVYYLNLMGGMNWMLFESNKQTKKYDSAFSTYLNKSLEDTVYNITSKKTYDLTSVYLTDNQSKLLKQLYMSPYIMLHNLESGEIVKVNCNTKSYVEKSFLNQGRKFFTQSITLTEAKQDTRK